MKEYQTLEKVTENIYAIYINDSSEQIDTTISEFLAEVISRKRNSLLTDGLQAAGVIEHDKAGFKINERDGDAKHVQSYEIIAQYLDGETFFTDESTVENVFIRREDPHSYMRLEMNEFPLRIVASNNKLLLHFSTKNDNISYFQLDIIERIIKSAELLYQQGKIEEVLINYLSTKIEFVRDERMSTEEQLRLLKEYLSSEKEYLAQTKRTSLKN